MTFSVLLVPVNGARMNRKKIEKKIEETNFPGDLQISIFHSGESVDIPTDLNTRAAPWHVCPVGEEFGEIVGKRCYKLNYCLMYIIDAIDELTEHFSNVDCLALLFPRPPTMEGGFFSIDRRCICVQSNISKLMNQLYSFTDEVTENFSSSPKNFNC